jgi:DNA invertase Pin-like site-specific DNA recombinase
MRLPSKEYLQIHSKELHLEHSYTVWNGTKRCKLSQLTAVRLHEQFVRSTKHLILALEGFRNLKIDFISYQENIDTSSPLGGAIFTIISAVPQLERDIIAERVKAGLRQARERGKRIGRPEISVDEDEIRRLRAGGHSLREIAEQVGISHTKVAQIIA